MPEDDFYSKLDKLDQQARNEREEMFKRQNQDGLELDRVAVEQKLSQEEHYRIMEEQRLEHARENDTLTGRLAAESVEREQQAITQAAHAEQAAREAAVRSQVSMSESKFVAAYVTDHEEVAKAKQFEEDKRVQDERIREMADLQAKGELKPVPREEVIEAERRRTDDELKRAQEAADEVSKDAQKKADREYGDDPDQQEEKRAQLDAKEVAIREALERQQRQIEEEARARLQRMLEPYGPERDR